MATTNDRNDHETHRNAYRDAHQMHNESQSLWRLDCQGIHHVLNSSASLVDTDIANAVEVTRRHRGVYRAAERLSPGVSMVRSCTRAAKFVDSRSGCDVIGCGGAEERSPGRERWECDQLTLLRSESQRDYQSTDALDKVGRCRFS